MKLTPMAIIAAGALAALTIPSFANSLGVADGFNAFIFNNMNQTSDSERALAVGGNLTVSSYSIASKGSNSTTNLVVGGNFNATYGTVTGSRRRRRQCQLPRAHHQRISHRQRRRHLHQRRLRQRTHQVRRRLQRPQLLHGHPPRRPRRPPRRLRRRTDPTHQHLPLAQRTDQ